MEKLNKQHAGQNVLLRYIKSVSKGKKITSLQNCTPQTAKKAVFLTIFRMALQKTTPPLQKSTP